MAVERLNLDERVAVEDYRRVSSDAKLEAESFDLLARAAAALTDPTLRTREDILIRILEVRGEAPFEAWDDQSELEIGQGLGRAAVLAKSRAESAGRMAVDAAQLAEQIEETGLPYSSE